MATKIRIRSSRRSAPDTAPPSRVDPCDRPTPAARDGEEELRCGCGSLLARVIAGQVELKCRRCKHVWIIPLRAA